jgi:hypothetical protein
VTTIAEWKRVAVGTEEARKYRNLANLLVHWGVLDPTVALIIDAITRLNKINPEWEVNFDRNSIEIPEVIDDGSDFGPEEIITEIESLESLIEIFEETEKGG